MTDQNVGQPVQDDEPELDPNSTETKIMVLRFIRIPDNALFEFDWETVSAMSKIQSMRVELSRMREVVRTVTKKQPKPFRMSVVDVIPYKDDPAHCHVRLRKMVNQQDVQTLGELQKALGGLILNEGA